ncbi:DUF6748 domain-containing protein [Archangium lansingense]|uniref:DUF6748 domain-containing protein n=1 Tax=Archangium lansingense TaxID=2995310 RepID=A0ABT4A9L4_9BACT|nr:DUF6748 domain-containing protein [Archangium lansinium]MCY1078338.1 hypothetical protein [Archangium lansinium]
MRKYLCAFLLLGLSACGPDGFFFDDIFHDAGAVQGLGTYRISDSGVQCVRAPCPSLLVSPLDSRSGIRVSGIEFPSSMSQQKRQEVSNLIYTPEGLVAHGAPRGEGDARVFVVQSLPER